MPADPASFSSTTPRCSWFAQPHGKKVFAFQPDTSPMRNLQSSAPADHRMGLSVAAWGDGCADPQQNGVPLEFDHVATSDSSADILITAHQHGWVLWKQQLTLSQEANSAMPSVLLCLDFAKCFISSVFTQFHLPRWFFVSTIINNIRWMLLPRSLQVDSSRHAGVPSFTRIYFTQRETLRGTDPAKIYTWKQQPKKSRETEM